MYLAENSELNSQADGKTSLGCEVAGERDQDDCGSWCDVGIEEDTVGAPVLACGTNTEVNSKSRADGETSLCCEIAGEPDKDDRDSRSCCDVGIEEDTVEAIVLAFSTNNELNSRVNGGTSVSVCEVAGEPDENDCDSCCNVSIEEDTVGVGAIVLAPAMKECPCCTTTHFTEMYVMQVQYFGDERVDWFDCSRKSYLLCIGILQMKD